MIRFLGVVIATEQEIGDMNFEVSTLRKRIDLLERQIPSLETNMRIFQSRAEKAEDEIFRVKDELVGCRKILEERRQAELARFKAKEK